MKKKLLIGLLVLSLSLGISSVKADTNEIYLEDYYSHYDEFMTDFDDSSSHVHDILSYYATYYQETYPYYTLFAIFNSDNSITYYLDAFQSSFSANLQDTTTSMYYDIELLFSDHSRPYIELTYDINTSSVITDDYIGELGLPYFSHKLSSAEYGSDKVLVSSNFDLQYNFLRIAQTQYTDYVITFPAFISSSYDTSFIHFSVDTGSNLPTYKTLSDGDFTPSIYYTEVNLNDYAYVALSLKNYNTLPFNTTFMVEGQLCLTPVYNYGMTEKTEFYNGYQVQSCTNPYSVSSPVSVSINQNDIDNNAIFYLKAYNLSIDNIVKIDTNVFDITYITSENANNPSVVIGGRSYPTIPYNNLTSSATTSTDNGYVSGQSCALGDVNCESEAMGLDISNIFTQPLEVLQSAWTSITNFFVLIGKFLALIPSPLREFLIASFYLAIILGLLKIIL